MASRLVNIVTERLLSVEEAFGRMEAAQLAALLQPIVEDELLREPYGTLIVKVLHPLLPMILTHVVANLQKEIGGIIDLRSVVLEAFMRDKSVLVELFQKVNHFQNVCHSFLLCRDRDYLFCVQFQHCIPLQC